MGPRSKNIPAVDTVLALCAICALAAHKAITYSTTMPLAGGTLAGSAVVVGDVGAASKVARLGHDPRPSWLVSQGDGDVLVVARPYANIELALAVDIDLYRADGYIVKLGGPIPISVGFAVGADNS